MVQSARPSSNGFVQAMRRVYNPIGFGKGYNFVFFVIVLGYLLGFSLSRTIYFAYDSVFCGKSVKGSGAAPGECYHWLQNPFDTGMKLHLFTIVPAGILVCFQFVPAIRHKLILFHRMNGYLVVLLSLVSDAGIIIICKHAFGGDYATQVWSGTLVILTTVGYIMAWINIKLLQIDQHRAWMMRTWAWFATIITIRLIMVISAVIMTKMGGWHAIRDCATIDFTQGRNQTLLQYPECGSYYDGSNPLQQAIVEAKFGSGTPIQIGAALGIPFAGAGWLALVIHTIIMELYLRMTPAESDRLRQVSYERQLESGSTRPGYAGLTAQRFGDANAFVPAHKRGKVEGVDERSES